VYLYKNNFILRNIKFIVSDWLSKNPNAIHLLEQNMDKIDWFYLSGNPNAIHLIEQNLDKIDWLYLSRNPSAIHLLEQNQHKICWELLSGNPNIFEIDYDYLRDRLKNSFGEELMMNRFHPRNFSKWTDWGFDIF